VKKSSSSTTAERDPALDRLRGALVVAMFAVHAYRVQAATLPRSVVEAAVEAGFRAAMQVEPFIAAGFLFVSGWAAALARAPWRATVRRAVVLWGLAALLAALQFGPAWPTLLVSPGVLSVIALGSLLVGAGERARRPALVHAAVAFGAVLLVSVLDHGLERAVLGLDAGPGGVAPLAGFAALGALGAHLKASERRWLTLTTAPALLAVLIGLAPLSYTERTLLPTVGGDVAWALWVEPSRWAALPQVPTAFWNHSALGAVALAPCLLAALSLARVARFLDALRGLSRHALLAYVGHLGVLGVLELAGVVPRRGLETAALVAILTLGFGALGAAVDARRARVAP
jgi:hypothetical protein